MGRADIRWTVTTDLACLSAEARIMNVNERIGAQIASARALADVAGQLLHAAATAIEDSTHKRADLDLSQGKRV